MSTIPYEMNEDNSIIYMVDFDFIIDQHFYYYSLYIDRQNLSKNVMLFQQWIIFKKKFVKKLKIINNILTDQFFYFHFKKNENKKA